MRSFIEDALTRAPCPACGSQLALRCFDGGTQPLSTIAWPASAEEAKRMECHPVDYVQCLSCTHIFNPAFDYAAVPYQDRPNLMFNAGAGWSAVVGRLAEDLSRRIGPYATVIDIGHGDGSFLRSMATLDPTGRYIGFDPNGAENAPAPVDLRRGLFVPVQHIAELRPTLVVCRHVLEHLTCPLAFLQEMALAAYQGAAFLGYFEVPCVDQALASGRTVDFFYEHPNQFTIQSFTSMLQRAGAEFVDVNRAYGGEVLQGTVIFGTGSSKMADTARHAIAFRDATTRSRPVIKAELDALAATGRRIAIWGGTGKAAAFANRYNLDATRFPLVVDSDPAKIGTYVPGTGQLIQSRDALMQAPPEVVIIPSQWRVADILAEMRSIGLAPDEILIEHNDRMLNVLREHNPYVTVQSPAECETA